MTRRLWLLAALFAAPAAAQQASVPPPMVVTPGAKGEAALPGAVPVAKPQGPGEVSKDAPVNGVLVLYGNQRCPTDSSGNEVVVCVRRSANEQFRIPKDLRDFKVTPQNESWANRVVADNTTGASGVGSCSVVGAGGQTGCLLKQMTQDRKENKERVKDQRELEAALQ